MESIIELLLWPGEEVRSFHQSGVWERRRVSMVSGGLDTAKLLLKHGCDNIAASRIAKAIDISKWRWVTFKILIDLKPQIFKHWPDSCHWKTYGHKYDISLCFKSTALNDDKWKFMIFKKQRRSKWEAFSWTRCISPLEIVMKFGQPLSLHRLKVLIILKIKCFIYYRPGKKWLKMKLFKKN